MPNKNSRVIVRIREMILHGGLRPGQRVKEVELAKALGVSRTPVREALPMLVEEGILFQPDSGGFLVREFTDQEIMDAIDVRGLLEGMAARILAEQGLPRRILHSLDECLREGDSIFSKGHLVETDESRYEEVNKQFHSIIVQGCGSKVIAEAIERNDRIPFAAAHAIAFDKIDLQRMYNWLWYAHRQHHAIVEALAHGEAVRVSALMFEHASAAKTSININITRQRWTNRGEGHPSATDDGEEQSA